MDSLFNSQMNINIQRSLNGTVAFDHMLSVIKTQINCRLHWAIDITVQSHLFGYCFVQYKGKQKNKDIHKHELSEKAVPKLS